MNWMGRLLNLFRRNRLDEEIDEELAFHLDARTKDNLRAGLDPDAARQDAQRRFGNRTLAKESAHEIDIIASLETVAQDIRYAFRSLRKSRGFVTVAILALTLGIGANTAVFTVINGVLLRPLPFPDAERLVLISYRVTRGPFQSGPGIADSYYIPFRNQSRSFDGMTTFGAAQVTMTGVGEASRLMAATVTPSFFPVLQVSPMLGRGFVAGEGRADLVVLGEKLWRNRFAANPSILGRTVSLDGTPRKVVGVMPKGFTFPNDADMWLPLEAAIDPHNSYFRPAVGRLRPTVTKQQAQAEFEAFAHHVNPSPAENRDGLLPEILPLKELLVGQIKRSLLVFMGAVGFVLLIACANVANLLLMRGASRRQEIAVRSALGARRGRLIRQLLTESVLVSLAGGIGGTLLALVGVPALLALAPQGRIPRIEEIHVDGYVLAFTFGLAVLTGLVFGIAPAFNATKLRLTEPLNQSARTLSTGRERLRGALVIAEIALALVLLTGAGLMVKSFLRMRAVNPGFRPDNILTMSVDLPESLYRKAVDMRAFHTRTLEKLASVPGVEAAGMVNWLPLRPMLIQGDFHVEDGRRLPPRYVVAKPGVSPDYFRVMGIKLLGGRVFTDRDVDSAPGVAVISKSVAQAVWPSEDPIRKRITLSDHPTPKDWLTIVGIVDDVRQTDLTSKPSPAIYQPYQQVRSNFFLGHMAFVVRTAANPMSIAPAMQSVLREVDKDQPLAIAAMTDVVAATTAEPWFQARLISIFSMLALVLSAIGIYGVLAYAVTERTREIGIRMALGADSSDITRMVLRRSLVLTIAGLTMGVIGALAVTRVLSKFLFDVKPTDPATFAIVAAMLATVALVAGLMPARRASRVDPLIALRCE